MISITLSLIILFITLILCSLVKSIIQRQNYFKNCNVPHYKSVPLLGSFADILLKKVGIHDHVESIYNHPDLKDKPYFGIFLFHKPALMITDPELIKKICITNFNSFNNRNLTSGKHDPLGSKTIFATRDELWRKLRGQLSPLFTNAKMKQMFPNFDIVSYGLMSHINRKLNADRTVEIDVKELAELYSTDLFAINAFGIEANSLENPEAEFRMIAQHIFSLTARRGFELTAHFILPELSKLLNTKMFSEKASDFMMKTMTQVINDREKSGCKRNDLIDALIEIKKSDDEATMDLLVAQAAGFFAAGFETSSAAMTFALYEIAKDQKVQKRLNEEIEEILEKKDGTATYEDIMHKATFLNQVVLETMRLYPVLPFIDRICTKPGGFSLQPYSDFTIPQNMLVLIPTYPILRDEKYFADPLKFDPERFSNGMEQTLKFFTDMPFGIGPRNCFGERFGILNIKLGIFKILEEYRVEATVRTPKQIRYARKSIVGKSACPLYLKFVKRNS